MECNKSNGDLSPHTIPALYKLAAYPRDLEEVGNDLSLARWSEGLGPSAQ